jgi:hypothetical protein
MHFWSYLPHDDFFDVPAFQISDRLRQLHWDVHAAFSTIPTHIATALMIV